MTPMTTETALPPEGKTLKGSDTLPGLVGKTHTWYLYQYEEGTWYILVDGVSRLAICTPPTYWCELDD